MKPATRFQKNSHKGRFVYSYLKFQVIHKNKVVGEERLSDTGWESQCYQLNPDNGVRWDKIVFPQGDYIRRQFTGLIDTKGKEMYDGDIIHTAGQDNFYLQVVEFHNTEETCGRGWVGRNIWLSDRFKNMVEPIERFSYFSIPHGEIIGNVYETPNLLKK